MKRYATVFLLSALAAQIATSTASMKAMFDGCGATKSCFVVPGGCMDTDSCTAAVTVMKDVDGVYIFEASSVSGVYVAVGISQSPQMGDTSVVECLHLASDPPESVILTTSYNIPTGWTNNRVPPDGIELLSGAYVDNAVSCSFSRQAVTDVDGLTFDIENETVHLLLAVGNQVTADGSLLYHEVTRAPSVDKRLLKDNIIFEV